MLDRALFYISVPADAIFTQTVKLLYTTPQVLLSACKVNDYIADFKRKLEGFVTEINTYLRNVKRYKTSMTLFPQKVNVTLYKLSTVSNVIIRNYNLYA